jgi:excinuclease ABC A subunit
MDRIEIVGGRIHNLKNIDLILPKNKIIAVTGISGSGKSSLAFDLLFEEGRSRYLQAIGMPPRLEGEKPFDVISGLSPTVAVEQRTVRYRNPRSTVGTRTGIYNYLRMLFAVCGNRLCPSCKEPVGHEAVCRHCGSPVGRLEIKHFSFNEPSGMCLPCSGRGYVREFREEKLVPDSSKNLHEVCVDATGSFADMRSWMPNLARHYGFDMDTPYRDLPKQIRELFLHGSGGEKLEFHMVSKQYTHTASKVYEGIIPHLERALDRGVSEYRKRRIEREYMDRVPCPACKGYRINEQAREVRIGGRHIGELAHLTIEELVDFLGAVREELGALPEGRALVQKILGDAKQLISIGLSYLHLNRATNSLSGGENQRLSLMAQMNLGLNGCVVILDEPTMGMHELEKASLGKILKGLKAAQNTVLIVEHDESLISIADEIVDLGPLSGEQGGQIVFQGPYSQILKCETSLTGRYLARVASYPAKRAGERKHPQPGKSIKMKNIGTNNLKSITVEVPLGLLVGVAGVSGSGKSSLISDTLVPLLKNSLAAARKGKSDEAALEDPGGEPHITDPLEIVRGGVEGWALVEACVVVDQSPIGRNRNSFPASYIGLWDNIRKLFSKQPLARERGYKEGHFSFNSDKGRCPACRGEGRITLPVSFLDEITLPCEECNGSRYISEILEVSYRGKNIREILDLSCREALEIFAGEAKILPYLQILMNIGIDYMTLGQPATTLSGGEAQRVKLAKALGSMKERNTLFVLDEPTSGLHFHDEAKLLDLLDKLVEQGGSVVVIEHNPHVLAFCDYIIELGPRGGPQGGRIIAHGSPEQIIGNRDSLIGPFLGSR